MAISREKKVEMIADYVDHLSKSDGVIIAEYRGLTVSELENLRGKIREAEGSFTVVKNTLARRAFAEAGLVVPEDMLVGPVGITFGHRNLTGVAKVMTDFAKDNEIMVVKGGVIGQSIIDPKAVKNLADMPPIEVLRAQLLGLLNTPASRLVTIFNAPASDMVNVLSGSVRQLVNVLSAYASKEGAEA